MKRVASRMSALIEQIFTSRIAVQRSAENTPEVGVQRGAPERNAIVEHVYRHDAQRLAVHREPIGVDVELGVVDHQPRPDVIPGPASGICRNNNNRTESLTSDSMICDSRIKL